MALPKVLITDKINPVAGDILKGVAEVHYKETLPEDEPLRRRRADFLYTAN